MGHDDLTPEDIAADRKWVEEIKGLEEVDEDEDLS